MSDEIKALMKRAAAIEMSPGDKEAQRRSFAYGNAHIENDRVTREMIDAAAERRMRR
jgi:hypothetical protein